LCPIQPPGSPPDFYEEVAAICRAHDVQQLALRHAGNADLAEDALQETFYSVARVKNPDHIENLQAFFCRALINKIRRLRTQLNPVSADDLEASAAALERAGRLPAPTPLKPVDEEAISRHITSARLARFHRDRTRLMALVPKRSPDPRRYQEVIVAAAEDIVREAADGAVSWADCDFALLSAYPEWFDQPGSARHTYYQRFTRARRDARALLAAVMDGDEPSP
jgi:DNA-directed RNA polymerase specialized sigma24 family protein